MNKQSKTYWVTYDKHIGGKNRIMVKATNAVNAIKTAKCLCHTGSNFRDAIETAEKYVSKQFEN